MSAFHFFSVCFMHLFVYVLLQIHSGGHADALQHQIQLQEEGGSDDRCGLVPLVCHFLPFAVRAQQHW